MTVARFGGIANILSGGQDKKLKLWDIAQAECVSTVEGHSDFVRAVRPVTLEQANLTGTYER